MPDPSIAEHNRAKIELAHRALEEVIAKVLSSGSGIGAVKVHAHGGKIGSVRKVTDKEAR